MKKVLLLFILFTITFMHAGAQTLQWASKVIEFSSQLTPNQYSAQQALGKPNVLPAGGENPAAWVPDKPQRKEFLKLGFANPTSIRQIAIAESYNPSALHRVLVYDEAGKEHEINTLNPKAIPLKGRMLNLFFEPTPYKVVAVKLEFDGAALPDYFGIDAVGITDSSYPVIPDISQPALLAAGIIAEPLDKNVNSDYSELNPLLSPDGKTLYFGRKNHPENIGGEKDKEDIWYSELGEDGKWQIAKNMGPQFNNASPNFLNAISSTPDGKSVIMILGNKYVEGSKKMQAGVSISTKVGDTWTKPTAINIINEYNYSDKANYFLANNRKILLMSIQREDSRGDRDLYVTFMKGDSTTWTEPLNLGRVVNTAAEESGPFLAAGDKTLYYSSKGFSGFGGSDIYVTKRLDDTWTKWSEPANLGPAINSAQEDLFFNIPANSDFAYYSRGISEGNTDIYRVGLPVIKPAEVIVAGKLVDEKTNEPIGANLVYERMPDGSESGIAKADSVTGLYKIKLTAGHVYGIRAEAKDHISESQTVDLREVDESITMGNKNFKLKPVEVGVTITLNNIFFDFDKAELKKESFLELQRVVQFMMDKKSAKIELQGHADNIGSADYNQKLSERRAEAVKNYLLTQNIESGRINVVGYGETKPIASSTDEDGRAKNRRVEFKIVKL